MKYIDICKKWLNLFHLISTFSDVLTSGFPSFHILSILANCFASKFSDLLTFINFMFPTFTQFEKWTVKKSNFDSFQKAILYSLPVVGLSMKYFYTILLPLLVSLANISKTWSFFKRAYFSSNLFANKKLLSNKNESFFNVGNFLRTLQVLNFKSAQTPL